ncbi:hypothetical protein OUZ56_012520 [Daphnia magna]|uniref:Uncharacterized protein n=1 Tax=Daphnia magna TaxID=35525 RepID=A0ABQ9Z4G5_9CRUS|nr:hypothetical protein OUZ56_012520 [Daphnia magna]
MGPYGVAQNEKSSVSPCMASFSCQKSPLHPTKKNLNLGCYPSPSPQPRMQVVTPHLNLGCYSSPPLYYGVIENATSPRYFENYPSNLCCHLAANQRSSVMELLDRNLKTRQGH